MNRAEHARALCNELRRLWLEAAENDREVISAEISGLTQRPAFASLTERVLAEMKGGSNGPHPHNQA